MYVDWNSYIDIKKIMFFATFLLEISKQLSFFSPSPSSWGTISILFSGSIFLGLRRLVDHILQHIRKTIPCWCTKAPKSLLQAYIIFNRIHWIPIFLLVTWHLCTLTLIQTITLSSTLALTLSLYTLQS